MSSSHDVFRLISSLTAGRGAAAFLEMDDWQTLACMDRIREHYSSWSPPPIREGEQRMRPATTTIRGMHRLPVAAITVKDEQVANVTFGVEPHASTLETLRRVASGALLYADSVVQIDPMSMRLDETFKEDIPCARLHLYDSSRLLEQARPLIDSGVVILVPDPGAETWIGKDIDAAARLLGLEDQQPWNASSAVRQVAAALYDLRIAAAVDASIMGIDRATWLAISVALQERPQPEVDLAVAAGLGYAELPFLTGVSCETVVRIRSDEDAFVEWRAGLRTAARQIRYSPLEEAFQTEARAVFEDQLAPKAAAVRRAVSRSAALRSAVRTEPIRAAFGAAATGAATAAAGLPIAGVMLGAAGGALGSVATSVVRSPRPEGAGRVFYELLR